MPTTKPTRDRPTPVRYPGLRVPRPPETPRHGAGTEPGTGTHLTTGTDTGPAGTDTGQVTGVVPAPLDPPPAETPGRDASAVTRVAAEIRPRVSGHLTGILASPSGPPPAQTRPVNGTTPRTGAGPVDATVTGNLTGAMVLDRVAAFIARYIAFPTPHALTAVTLWAAHTHAVGCFYVTPRLVLDSAEPGSGKTRVLELLALLCRDPEMTISASTAALFRLISLHPHTILFDEVDAIFNPRASGNYEDLRALLNAGYKRGATIARCVGDAKSMAVQRFTVFSPVALAGLAGNMPSTILTRAVTIHMRRRAPGEHVAPFEEQYAETEATPIREALAAWVADVAQALAATRPEMPAGVVDRPAEVWRALLAVAELAGAGWPLAARDACRHFVDTATPPTLGTRLLADLHTLYAGRDRMATVDILDALTAMEEAPWADLGGKPLDARKLAKELARYGVAPVPIRDGPEGKPAKGYTVHPTTDNTGLADAWGRYLSGLCGYTGYSGYIPGQSGNRSEDASVTSVTPQGHVTDVAVTPQDPVTGVSSNVTDVTAVTDTTRPRAARPPHGRSAAA